MELLQPKALPHPWTVSLLRLSSPLGVGSGDKATSHKAAGVGRPPKELQAHSPCEPATALIRNLTKTTWRWEESLNPVPFCHVSKDGPL